MNLNFKRLIFTALITINSSYASIILITHKNNEKSKKVKNILINKINIPKILIKSEYQDTPCVANTDKVAHICIDSKDKLKILHADFELIKQSFYVFNNENNND
jgi:hypothetical protein